jgi:hypothetical protein
MLSPELGHPRAEIRTVAFFQTFKPAPPIQGVKLMEGERLVFAHEIEPSRIVRILASGEVDDAALDAPELYIQLSRKLLTERRRQQPKSHDSGEQ